MRRIAVIGTTGAGKTIMAREISARLGFPHVELDALFWGPNWSESPREIFRGRVDLALRGNAWVVDGVASPPAYYSSSRQWRRVVEWKPGEIPGRISQQKLPVRVGPPDIPEATPGLHKVDPEAGVRASADGEATYAT